MLTEDERRFIDYWEKNRNTQKNFLQQLVRGLPYGLVFALPVLVAVIFHSWYKTMVYISTSQVIVIILGVFAVTVFFAVFRMKFKWENNEQHYKELKLRESKTDAADV